jgi:hypothetical protein
MKMSESDTNDGVKQNSTQEDEVVDMDKKDIEEVDETIDDDADDDDDDDIADDESVENETEEVLDDKKVE